MWGHSRKVASGNQGERPQEKLNMLVHWSETSSPQNWKKTNLGYLSHLVCAVLLWQPSWTNTLLHRTFHIPRKWPSCPFKLFPLTASLILSSPQNAMWVLFSKLRFFWVWVPYEWNPTVHTFLCLAFFSFPLK